MMEWVRRLFKKISPYLAVVVVVGVIASPAVATTYSSTSYTIENPVIGGGGSIGSSTSYQLQGVVGQVAEGLADGSTSEVRAGSLYYPVFSTAPVITSATAGVGQVTLVWSAASGNVSVDEYEVGSATVSNGQVFTSVGNVLTTVVSGLTGGTTYYFKIKASDASGSVTTTSAEVSATPTVASAGGGSSGGGVVTLPPTVPPQPPTPTPTPTDPPVTDPEQPEPLPEEEVEVGIPASPTALNGESIRASTIRWNYRDNSDNENRFVLVLNGQSIAVNGSNTTYIDENVSPNTLLAGRAVYAENGAGVSASSSFASVRSAIETPRTLYGQQFGIPNALQLRVESESVSFTNLVEGLSAIEFINTTKGTSSGWVKTDNIVVSGLDNGVPYTFQARARNATGRVTAYSAPFTFTLPGQPPAEIVSGEDVDEESVYAIPLNIISPGVNAVVDKSTIVELRTEPYAIITLQINATVSTALADEQGVARFRLEDLPSGLYQVSAIAVAQNGGRSRLIRSQFVVESVDGEDSVGSGFVAPLAPEIVPPPEIIQPPLTKAEIVANLDTSVAVNLFNPCGWKCWFIIIFTAIYIVSVLVVWYVVWRYYFRPIGVTKRRSVKK